MLKKTSPTLDKFKTRKEGPEASISEPLFMAYAFCKYTSETECLL